jgi:hypothetical protein
MPLLVSSRFHNENSLDINRLDHIVMLDQIVQGSIE